MTVPLAMIEAIVDSSGIAPAIEAMLPAGARRRQLTVRTLVTGMLLALADGRPAHLTRVHAALTSLPETDQARLGVTASWKKGPHQLTYRQVEYTFALVAAALSKDQPDGTPSDALAAFCDQLLEASIPAGHKNTSASLAADWTDVESWSRPPRHGTTACADPEAAWGHRNSNLPGPKGEMFFGYYLSAATMTREENGPAVPELARRMTACSCKLDPARALAPVLTALPAQHVPLGDILNDSGFAYRDAAAWAIPLRQAGAQLVQDLHPNDRGPQGTCHGATIANGNLYCPQAPRTLLQLAPLPPAATTDQATAHDHQATELARYKLGRHTSDDAGGYHRVMCPAAAGKIRCPLRPASMTLPRDRPEILAPPADPQPCCTQQTITISPDIAAKTRQKHDYPSREWRLSYRRRTTAERSNATIKDTAASNIARGWCRLMGLAPLTIWLACLLVIRNQRILTAWNNRQEDNARRAIKGLPPRTRKRRRRAALTTAPPLPDRTLAAARTQRRPPIAPPRRAPARPNASNNAAHTPARTQAEPLTRTRPECQAQT